MDHLPSTFGNSEDSVGIPDDLRCKRSDGKQWRCTAMSMPDKTVCEKHYIQAKKRAANSALRASLKKAKRHPLGESDGCMDSKSDDDMDSPLVDYAVSISGKKYKEKASKKQANYSPETPSFRSLSVRNSSKQDDDLTPNEENLRSYMTPSSVMNSSQNQSEKIFDATTMSETSDGALDSSHDTGVEPCHQCQRYDRDRVVWCLRCERRGYCDECISVWYPEFSMEDVERICPACCGNCNCKMCLRGDNLIKARIRDIPAQEKLEHLHCLLSSVLPVVKQIHLEQCSELELERRIQGNGIDLSRTKLNADEQMCCDFCRMPVIDYHRHCVKCSFDICLSCCQDLREASKFDSESLVKSQINRQKDGRETQSEKVKPSKARLNMLDNFFNWKANSDGSIPCPPKEYGGCGFSSLVLKRIFKMNWVAKLVKNVDEMVRGCKVYDSDTAKEIGLNSKLCKFSERENSNDNSLYCPSSQDIKKEGIRAFRKHWIRGEPVIVGDVSDVSSMLGWDPMVMWRGIQDTTEEKTKDDNRTVKAVDCLDWSEIDIPLGQFIKGYSEGRIHENGWPEMLRLKNWPSPSASEEFLLYQRPEIISRLPLLEYIHTKWGLLNVPAKLPHYSLQNDVGPKILISYGMYKELGRGDSVNNLCLNTRDMTYILVHTCEVKLKGWQTMKIEKIQKGFGEPEAKKSPRDMHMGSAGVEHCMSSFADQDIQNEWEVSYGAKEEDRSGQGIITTSCDNLNRNNKHIHRKTLPGAEWDVFRREDVPKLLEYLRIHSQELGIHGHMNNDSVHRPLYDGSLFLNGNHKRKLKEEFSVEPWSFEQQLGEAVFIPAGCPFQMRNLQSTVQLGLDFLSPESLGEAERLAAEIRGLPNNHDAKLQMLEVGKISLYAASSAIKDVQKLVMDQKLGTELGFEDPNLTLPVSANLERMIKQRKIACP